jgi:NarL family two-component system sensor histidine kinase YdfH
MARELHDTLAQGLAGLILQLEAVDVHLEQGGASQAQKILHQAMSRARTTLVDARKAIDDLRAGPSDPRELAAALEQEIRRFESATGISCTLSIDLPDQFPGEYSEHILRIVSEGISNIARHAQAQQAQVNIADTGETIDIRIQDDGIGFDPQVEMNRAGHYGLLGIRERVRLAGGEVDYLSKPGGGTQLHISLPNTSNGKGAK